MAEVTVAAPELDDVGRVVDFGVIQARVGGWIDEHWDHTTLVNNADEALRDFCEDEALELGKRPPFIFDGEPTAENIAAVLLVIAQSLLGEPFHVKRVRVFETPNCWADAHV